MEELFQNIPVYRKNEIAFWVNQSFTSPTGKEGAEKLMQLRASLNEEEQEFMDFYWHLLTQREEL